MKSLVLYLGILFISGISWFFLVLPEQVSAIKSHHKLLSGSRSQIRTPFFESQMSSGTVPTSEFYYRFDHIRSGWWPEKTLFESNLSVQWLNDAWGVQVHGASKSTPAVDSTGVYVGFDSGWFVKFLHDGSVAWKFYTYQETRGIHSTPLLTKEFVYIGNYNGRFYCLDKSNGSLVWETKLGQGFGSSPVMLGSAIIVAVEMAESKNGFFTSIDSVSGKVNWVSEWLGEQIHSSPAISEELQIGIAGANNGNLYAFDVRNGDLIWVVSLGKPVKSTPLIIGNFVYATTWNSELRVLDVITGQFVKTVTLPALSQSSPTFFKKSHMIVFTVSHPKAHLIGVDSRTMQEKWRIMVKSDGPLISSAIGFNDISGEERGLIGLKNELVLFNPSNGKIIFRAKAPSNISGVPTIFGNTVYTLGDGGELIKWGI